MPFIPHTQPEVDAMLATIGVSGIEALFDEIPKELRCKLLDGVPAGLSEMEVTRLFRERMAKDQLLINFCGAGAYEHHIPAAVWEITTRGEFYSAYTPYQAEASQGTLQLLYEYQSMMCELTGMEVSNASMYDGASALAEALLMAARIKGGNATPKVMMPSAVHPYYRQVVEAITATQGFEVVAMPYDAATGATRIPSEAPENLTAVVVAQPNFFGALENVDALTDWTHSQGALVVGLVNPVSLALLNPPGSWGAQGADIVCGEGQPLGVPLASGGPYFGFLTSRTRNVRQMPGRIVGRTVDMDGKPGYTLTLQAREQHIRRSKATSNICTNQGLLVTAATIHMSLIGAEGLRRVAASSMTKLRELKQALVSVAGVEDVFSAAVFHETVLRLPQPVAPVLERLAQAGIHGGFDLSRHYPELGNALLVCATEMRTDAEIERYASAMKQTLN